IPYSLLIATFVSIQKNVLKQALTHIQACRDLCRRINAGRQASGRDDIAILLTLYEFEAKAKLGESDASLESCLQKAIALPYCEAKTFETLAALAVEPPAFYKDISMKSLRLAVKKHKNSNSVDFNKLSKVYHSLIEMSLNAGSSSDANSKEEAWGIYQEILECIDDNEKATYPEMEAIWLMTKAWNCGIHLFSSGRLKAAEKWCATAMRLLQQLNGFKNNYESKNDGNIPSKVHVQVENGSFSFLISSSPVHMPFLE
ncbi:testis-expressed protein 11-like, partial [Actinia tenebrosa]|uniref:Testis-expressed protein 11-like n=1 Tax=Actinia tenebrosa TaxID=6105 RepID=A0A6P8J3Q3_ACTTE